MYICVLYMYVCVLVCFTLSTSRLAHKFSRAFCTSSESLSLPEILSQFSLPVSLGDIKEAVPDEVSVTDLLSGSLSRH